MQQRETTKRQPQERRAHGSQRRCPVWEPRASTRPRQVPGSQLRGRRASGDSGDQNSTSLRPDVLQELKVSEATSEHSSAYKLRLELSSQTPFRSGPSSASSRRVSWDRQPGLQPLHLHRPGGPVGQERAALSTEQGRGLCHKTRHESPLRERDQQTGRSEQVSNGLSVRQHTKQQCLAVQLIYRERQKAPEASRLFHSSSCTPSFQQRHLISIYVCF